MNKEIKIIKYKDCRNEHYDTIVYGAMKDNVIWVEIYRGLPFAYKTPWQKYFWWIIQYVNDKKQEYEYEKFRTFKEAVVRAKEIVKEKTKE